MKDIAIYGAGGFGREIACLIKIINESREEPLWELVGFFDDNVQKGTMVSHFGSVHGGMEELNGWETDLDVAIAIGDPQSLKFVQERIDNRMIHFPNVIHPSFKINDSSTFDIGEGNIIQGECSASCNVSIGNFNVLNGSVMLGHDDVIGNYNIIMPKATISGGVTIGENNLIGACAIILPQIKIGHDVKLAAGSVMMTKPKDGNTYLGNPAKIFKIQ